MKRKVKIAIAVIVLIIPLIPIPTRYKDGWEIKVVGIPIYDDFGE